MACHKKQEVYKKIESENNDKCGTNIFQGIRPESQFYIFVYDKNILLK
jgi:hypothetical protein